MARIIRCDRCGIEQNEADDNHHHLGETVVRRFTAKYNYWETEKDYCTVCIKEIQEVLDKKVKRMGIQFESMAER